jgi:excisionase family DNA binding protein
VEKKRINAHGPDRNSSRLTIAEAAALVGVHKNTVRNRIKAGTYKAQKVVTKHGPTYLIERRSLLNSLTTNAQPRGSRERANLQAPELAQEALHSFVEDTVATRGQLVTERTRRESAERERDELRQKLRKLRRRLEERQEPIEDASEAEGMRTSPLGPASHAAEAMSTVSCDKSRRLLMGSLAIGLAVLLVSTLGPVLVDEDTQKMATPSYFYPGPLWTQMEKALPKQSTVIVNPSSGPGSAMDHNYAARVKRDRAANLTVLGYVYTDYGRRPSAVVKSDIDKYYSWYGVDGIFFDQASTDCTQARSYYKDLYGYVNDQGGRVVLNPGTQTNECYLAVADIVVNFEGTYANYASESYSQPEWIKKYPATRFWHLVHTAATKADMQDAVRLSRERNAGFVYVTPDTLPNPWDTLPVYLNDQLMALQGAT